MAIPALDTTIGGSAANSFVTLAEADDFFDATLDNAVWHASNADDRKRALLMAVSRLASENWLGNRVTSTQNLPWPRIGCPKRDGAGISAYLWTGSSPYIYGEEYLSTEIPNLVKEGQCLLAQSYLAGEVDQQGDQGEISEYSMDGLAVKRGQGRPANSLPLSVMRLIGALLRGNRLIRA